MHSNSPLSPNTHFENFLTQQFHDAAELVGGSARQPFLYPAEIMMRCCPNIPEPVIGKKWWKSFENRNKSDCLCCDMIVLIELMLKEFNISEANYMACSIKHFHECVMPEVELIHDIEAKKNLH